MANWLSSPAGDGVLELWLLVALVVAFVSSAGWLVARFLGRQPALRHLVLQSALVSSLVIPLVAWVCAASGLTLIWLPLVGDASPGDISRVTLISTALVSTVPAAEQARPQQTRPGIEPPLAANSPRAKPLLEPQAEPAGARAAHLRPATTTTPPVPRVERWEPPATESWSLREIATRALIVWAAGTVLLVARLGLSCSEVLRLRRRARPSHDERAESLLRAAADGLGMRHIPRLLVVHRPISPLAVGFGRPAILVPAGLLDELGDDELRDILVHELAHLARRDQWMILLEGLAGALYWPMVSVHAINRELRRVREEICDNVVLSGRDPVEYGETLFRVAGLLVHGQRMRAAVGIFDARGELERRIVGLVDAGRSRQTATSRRTALAVMALFVTVGAVASATRLAPAADVAEPEAPPATGGTESAASAEAAFDLDDPQHAGRFRGTVVGPDGQPLAGARVYVAPQRDHLENIGPVRAVTGADGNFDFVANDMTYTELDGLPARRQGRLVVTAAGYGPDWINTWGHNYPRLRSHWDPVRGAALDMRLAADDVPIRGRLLGPDGKPLVDAEVEITQVMIPRWRDMDRHLEKEEHPGGLFSTIDYDRSLYAPSLIEGLPTTTRTDAEGRFTLTGIGRDRFVQLSVSAPDVINTSFRVMTRDAADHVVTNSLTKTTAYVIHGANFTHELKPGLTATGLVRDRDTHAPVPGMWVSKSYNPLTYPASQADAPVTDEEGRFTITGLNPELLTWDEDRHRKFTAFPQPGNPYAMARGTMNADGTVVIDSVRGIPFRLKLTDEDGNPVEAEVEYRYVEPNPLVADVVKPFSDVNWTVLSQAARRGDGSYEGAVLPGPGAVLVKTPSSQGYRPAHVDPKAFFAPDRTDWTPAEDFMYGTDDKVATGGGWIDQRRYQAIVLVNPPADSGPLELTATLQRDRPLTVTLVDPDGEPVVGAKMEYDNWQTDPLRAATIPLTRLHPDRARRVLFTHEDRQLIAELTADGDDESPQTVVMQPWGTITGRLVDSEGNRLPIWSPVSDFKAPPKMWAEIDGDPDQNHRMYLDVESSGRFRIDKLIPGRPYNAHAYPASWGTADQVVAREVVTAGEIRDLGDLSTSLSYEPSYKEATPDEQTATANIPDAAWGEPVNGLRVAIVLHAPPVDEHQQLRFDVVIENVGEGEIRFGAGRHYEYGYLETEIVDPEGAVVPPTPGPRPGWADTLPIDRWQLQPGQRAVLPPSTAKLVKLDAAGEPLPPPERSEYYHSFHLQPGEYSISAQVTLGSGETCPKHEIGPEPLEFAAEGEWRGKLETGVVWTTLLSDDP